MTTEQQIRTLVKCGYSFADAERVVAAAVALVPETSDLAIYLPSAQELDTPIGEADVTLARAEWYATAPNRYKRLLDATEATNA